MAELFRFNLRELKALGPSFTKAGKRYVRKRQRVLKRIGVLIQGVAREYSPESPTVGMFAKQNVSGKTARKRSGITSGSLRDSITHETKREEVSIFVPTNSRAGSYAHKIHDEKGKSWKKRGPRTRQKGPKADEKFIYRAYDDKERSVDKLIDTAVKELIDI